VHRILRRGIPFGPPLPIGATEDPAPVHRGLLFISYQASIAEQFEFLNASWANDVSKPFTLSPPTGSGYDMIIGQRNDVAARFCLVGASMERVESSARWVTPTGGGYFFAPSKTALSTVLV
jgi:deferrochelatase/peroxidase EfeB